MRKHYYISIMLLLSLLTTACGDKGAFPMLQNTNQTNDATAVLNSDPLGPIPAPKIPDELISAAERTNEEYQEEKQNTKQNDAVKYKIEVVSDDAPELKDAYLAVSNLVAMQGTPISDVAGITQRLRSDMQSAQDVLHAYGYYGGSVRGRIVHPSNRPNTEPEKVEHQNTGSKDAELEKEPERKNTSYVARIVFRPGEQYTIGQTVVTTSTQEIIPKRIEIPQNLNNLGLASGDPAIAENVLSSVDNLLDFLINNGFPWAKIDNTRYTVDHLSRTLDAEITINTGKPVRMGELEVKGDSNVTHYYLNAMRTWRTGRLWNQERIERYREALRGTGLFQSVEINPGETEGDDNTRSVVVETVAAPERTIGGALKYNSDYGPGVLGYWTHRNLTGRGDKLHIEMPLWADMQVVSAQYRLPFFLDTKQDFVAQVAALNEDVDAYDLQSISAAVGIERRFTRRLTGSIKVSAEGGKLETPDEPKHEYIMFGLPTQFTYNHANSLLDATKGYRFSAMVAPYTGRYDGDFNVLRTRLDAHAFLPVIGEDTLVLAVRGTYGFLSGADSQNLPTSVRFYSGGGGSVRGYSYKSLGPRNDKDDPLGASSLIETSIEARYKFTPTMGVVAFIDGGMAYADNKPDFDEDLRWGAGLGFRYYTVIGPVRVDVATPLNKRDDDDLIQLYISIGQSF